MTTSSVLPDVPWSDAPVPSRNASVTTDVTEIAAPATKAAESRRQLSLVARKIALRIYGPAIITNASGMIFARVTPADPPVGRGGRQPYKSVASTRSRHRGQRGGSEPHRPNTSV